MVNCSYNTTITYYGDIVQVKFYDSISKSSGGSAPSKESKESLLYRSLSRTRKKVFDYARMNLFEYFVTLTFNPSLVDSFDFDESSSVMSKWLHTLRQSNSDMRYLGVPELHKSGRYHFHFLMAGIPNVSMVDSGHRTPRGEVIYNVGSYRYGFSTAIRLYSSGADLAGYLSKYISKDIMSHVKGRKRYWCSKNLVLPDYKVIHSNLQRLMADFSFMGYEIVYSSGLGSDGCTVLEYKKF